MLDRATGRISTSSPDRARSESTWFTLDAATGKLLGETRFPFRKMDDPASDGAGRLFAPVRYDQMVLQLDSRTLREQARWNVGCNVSKMRYDARSQRLVGACGGDKPSVFVPEPRQRPGHTPASRDRQEGWTQLVIDQKRQRIVTSNGEGTMTVIRYDGGDRLEHIGTIPTRIGARMMDIDQRTGKLYLVNAGRDDLPRQGRRGRRHALS